MPRSYIYMSLEYIDNAQKLYIYMPLEYIDNAQKLYIYICRWSISIMPRSYIFLLIRKMPVTYASTSDQSNEF